MYQVYSDELYHHGILGQKWGVRRFQYEDGSLTPESELNKLYDETFSKYDYSKARSSL